jgi:hypothetical protein
MTTMPTVLRVAGSLLGGLMFWMGFVWILQGINLLPGSFMTGDIKWALFGALLLAAGLALVVFTHRRAKT